MRVTAAAVVFLLLATLPVGAQNLLPDPTFSTGVGAWVAEGPGATLQWSALPGSDGVSGFARLRGLGPGGPGAQVCVPVVGGRTYSWGASLSPVSAAGLVILEFYPNGSCQGVTVVSRVFGPAAVASNTWTFLPGPNVTTPAGAGSVMFRVIAQIPGSQSGGVDFDNVYFGLEGTQPPGVVDVPALSWPLSLLLFVALATAGLRLLRLD